MASNVRFSIASIIAWRLEPLPEAKTPMRIRLSGIANRALALFHDPDLKGSIPAVLRASDRFLTLLGRHDQDQTDAEVEDPGHFVRLNRTPAPDQLKDRWLIPSPTLDHNCAAFRKYARNVFGETSTRNVRDRVDLTGFYQLENRLHVDPCRLQEHLANGLLPSRHFFLQCSWRVLQKHLSRQRIAMAVAPCRGKPDHDVSGFEPAAVDDR